MVVVIMVLWCRTAIIGVVAVALIVATPGVLPKEPRVLDFLSEPLLHCALVEARGIVFKGAAVLCGSELFVERGNEGRATKMQLMGTTVAI